MKKFDYSDLQPKIKRLRWSKRSKVILVLFAVLVLVVIAYHQITSQNDVDNSPVSADVRQVVVASVRNLSLDNIYV